MRSKSILSISLAACFLAGSLAASNPDPQLPSLNELEKMAFIPRPVAGDLFPYNEVSSFNRLFIAYDATAQSIVKYRDPILTRGAQGEAIFRIVSPAVVAIIVGSVNKDDKFDPEGLGTGAIVDPRGFVLTNWHVVNGYPGGIVFLKPTGNADLSTAKAFGARVIYQDPLVDLALLKMVSPPTGLQPLRLGEISQVQVAEDIHIIGHPHGNLWSYSTGVVSQIRDGYTWTYHDGSNHEAKVLQLQTAINPGNSGGPVVDDQGAILGLVAMSEEGQNLNYAIAADVLKKFLFTGMQMNTRGATASAPSAPPQELLSGELYDTMLISKAVYQDVVLFEIKKKDGTSLGIVAKFKDGTVLRGGQPDANGNLRSWSADLTNGRHLFATASNGFMSGISHSAVSGSLSR
jgi:S1-C subfamily serine protease